ncbi:MAG TPA: hypothetical protein P5268_08845 [Candidatus Marinimicrobia bacterium]|jgi:hypothetical protein|nr:hypothetical protein [Candidatus Neomarinimicrobiota bacterium]HRS52517.1 hypothetical protein [Candidatus Neomarinimicrobiota bacterium]HRU93121.1 hypothetical protein [Candidatus Neomarinimicrobiota bacterium]
MSNIFISSPDKKEILNKNAYLKWRNIQIKQIYDNLKKEGKHPFPILKKLTGLGWNALWQIINYDQEDI